MTDSWDEIEAELSKFSALPAAERDAAYDNAGAVADSAARIARWTADSARLRAAWADHLDLSYGPRERNRWDLFPAAAPGAPCLVFVHGGYWQRNAKEVFACMAEGVLASGWSAALPGYTLAPDATLAEIVREIGVALDWLGAQGPAHGVAGPVVVSGWSAGGHLAALALDHPRVAAGLAISGLFDLAPLRLTALNDKLRLSSEEIAALSPMRRPSSKKRLDVAYGGAELPALVAQSRRFHALRSRAACAGALHEIPGRNHFDVLEDLRHPDGPLCRAVRALV